MARATTSNTTTRPEWSRPLGTTLTTIDNSATRPIFMRPAVTFPGFLSGMIWADWWNGNNGVPAEVVTQYGHDGDGACRMTAPDGTIYKEYYGSGWQSGLTTQSEIWSGGVRQKWTTTQWTQ